VHGGDLGRKNRQIGAASATAAYATEFLMRRNLMISNAAIYCALVVRDAVVVSLR